MIQLEALGKKSAGGRKDGEVKEPVNKRRDFQDEEEREREEGRREGGKGGRGSETEGKKEKKWQRKKPDCVPVDG